MYLNNIQIQMNRDKIAKANAIFILKELKKDIKKICLKV